MNNDQLIELLENEDFPNVCDTHTGRIYGLRRLIVIVLPDGKEVLGMIYSNNSEVYCHSLDDFKDFEVA